MRNAILMVGLLAYAACSSPEREQQVPSEAVAGVPDTSPPAVSARVAAARAPGLADVGPRTELPPNELGRVPVLEYHLIGAENSRWTNTPERLRSDLEQLWERGYRPVSMRELIDHSFALPAGTSPVVVTFDDASPSQFRYLERDGKLVIDPTSAVGVWLDFARTHPGWRNRAVFCVLSGAEAGRSFFGDKGIEGQKTEWRQQKIAYLAAQGFEICNHTLWHATLSKYGDAEVQEQIARLLLAVDSAVPGYDIRTFALPLGVWPKHRALAHEGSWTDPKTGKVVEYRHDAVLLVGGGPARSPYDPEFKPLAIPRVQAQGEELRRTLDELDRSASRYVSDGNPGTVARPAGAT